jgi:exodeoxyribonuclease-3
MLGYLLVGLLIGPNLLGLVSTNTEASHLAEFGVVFLMFTLGLEFNLAKLKAMQREIILCGDWNIAHQPIDLKNWRSNQKNSGFLPEERAWLTHLFDELGFVDVFRKVDPRPEQYTWWSNRGEAWAKNVGWRLDYQIATPGIAAKAHAAAIYKNRRFSDHAPLIIDYDYELR